MQGHGVPDGRGAIPLPPLQVGADRRRRRLGTRRAQDDGVALDAHRLRIAVVAGPAAGAVLGLVGRGAAHPDIADESLPDAIVGEDEGLIAARRHGTVAVVEAIPEVGVLPGRIGLPAQAGADELAVAIADGEADLAVLGQAEGDGDVPGGPAVGGRLLLQLQVPRALEHRLAP